MNDETKTGKLTIFFSFVKIIPAILYVLFCLWGAGFTYGFNWGGSSHRYFLVYLLLVTGVVLAFGIILFKLKLHKSHSYENVYTRYLPLAPLILLAFCLFLVFFSPWYFTNDIESMHGPYTSFYVVHPLISYGIVVHIGFLLFFVAMHRFGRDKFRVILLQLAWIGLHYLMIIYMKTQDTPTFSG